MLTNFDHLTDLQRQDLQWVLETLFRAFGDEVRRKGARRQGQILKVIHFGHRAREEATALPVAGAEPNYNLLVVVSSDEVAKVADFWMDAFARLDQAFEVTRELSARPHVVVHSLGELNRELGRGRPYFVGMLREGVPIFEASDEPLARPAKPSPHEAYAEAKENFDRWSASAAGFIRCAIHAISAGDRSAAAFLLNQSTEQIYHCLLLTETLYSPRSHNLDLLRSHAERVAPELIPAWPQHRRFEERAWEKLRRSYTEARFSRDFAISDDQLAWLAQRVIDLQARVEQSCTTYLQAIAPSSSTCVDYASKSAANSASA